MRGLVLDGGGVLGVGQAYVLDHLSPSTHFDFVAGTSVGALSAVLHARRQPVSYVDLFRDITGDIFGSAAYRRAHWAYGPKYDDRFLNQTLRNLFPGDFGDTAIPVFVAATDMNRERLKVFYSRDPEDARWPMWEVLRIATAAESYFLPWKGFADGGIFANNPSVVATAGAVARFKVPLSELEICSIGTGRSIANSSVGSTRFWTKIYWAKFLIDALLYGAADSMHHFFMDKLPVSKYVRFEFDREPGWEFDDPNIIEDVLVKWKPSLDTTVANITAMF